MSVKIHKLSSTDELYQKCLEIRFKVFVEEQKVPEDEEIESEDDSEHFLLTLDSKPVATARIRPIRGTKIVKFERIASHKEHRGKGYSAKLMEHVQEHVKKTFPNHKLLMLSQLTAEGFYSKLGWKRQSDELIQEAGMDHVYLVLD